MLFESRVFFTPKDTNFPNEYEDGFQLDGERGIAAIADGVSSAVFSRQWADVLTRAVLSSPPDLDEPESFKQWLEECRRQWAAMIDVASLPWNLRAKLKQVGGGFSTLLWVELTRNSSSVSDLPEQIRMRCYALGDCSLFHVRNGAILRSFPLTTVAEFEQDPLSVCSVNLNRDHCLEFHFHNEICEPGDLLVLCTDAIGKWAIGKIESASPPDWESYWNVSEAAWLDEIQALRQSSSMRFDDSTLLLLRVVGVPQTVNTATEPVGDIVVASMDSVAEVDMECSLAAVPEIGDDLSRAVPVLNELLVDTPSQDELPPLCAEDGRPNECSGT